MKTQRKNTNRILVTTILAIGLIISGCDHYISNVPISQREMSEPDSNLIGSWAAFENDTLDYAMRIDPLDEHSYVINVIDLESGKTITAYKNFIAHSTRLAKGTFANIMILSGENRGKFLLYRYQLSGDTLLTYYLSESDLSRSFSNTRELEDFAISDPDHFIGLFTPAHKMIKLNYEGKCGIKGNE